MCEATRGLLHPALGSFRFYDTSHYCVGVACEQILRQLAPKWIDDVWHLLQGIIHPVASQAVADEGCLDPSSSLVIGVFGAIIIGHQDLSIPGQTGKYNSFQQCFIRTYSSG